MLWNDRERDRLLELWPQQSVTQIATALKRTRSSVRSAIDRYRLRRHKINGWQPDEIARLTAMWPHYPASVIASKLGRSRNAVVGQIYRQRRAGHDLTIAAGAAAADFIPAATTAR